MSRPESKGWCPGALRPMMSGDGLIVRIRPRLCRLSAAQVLTICEAAEALGSGIIELTSRANLQLRGVTPDTHSELIDRLSAADLVDDDPHLEARNNIIVAPFWHPGDDTARIAEELESRLSELPELPSKFGFAIDAGDAPLLTLASADIRVERSAEGELLVRRDGAEDGQRVTTGNAVNEIIKICYWFMETGGATAKRMRRHVPEAAAQLVLKPLRPAASKQVPRIGPAAVGPIYGATFGKTTGTALANLMRACRATALRTTPWRRFVMEDGHFVERDDFIVDASDPVQDVDACPGAPYCSLATVETHALANALANASRGGVHVSGCVKGCARSTAAALTLVGRDGRFDIIRDGSACDTPQVTGLDPATVVSWLGDR